MLGARGGGGCVVAFFLVLQPCFDCFGSKTTFMLSTFRPLRGVSSLFSRLRLCAQARTDTAQRYDACDRAIIYRINDDPTGAAWIYTAVDFDGTASLTGVTSIVGSHLAWWRCSPTCQKYADWTCGCVRVLTAPWHHRS